MTAATSPSSSASAERFSRRACGYGSTGGSTFRAGTDFAGATSRARCAVFGAATLGIMPRNRGMASIGGVVHRLNIFRFQEAAMREALRVAKRDGLVSPWVVEVCVYNEDGSPSYLATVCDGLLVAWEEKDLEEPMLGVGEPLVLDPDRMSLLVGYTHDEMEDGLADGTWVVVMDEVFPEQGRVKVAGRIDTHDVTFAKWRDENQDGIWVWVETFYFRKEWIQMLEQPLGHPRGRPRGSA